MEHFLGLVDDFKRREAPMERFQIFANGQKPSLIGSTFPNCLFLNFRGEKSI